ncbi:MAG TPA: adenosylcobalamin-dependent ribonucleoside-diphosphate reductase [Bacteroidales bacterium]|nr:adenosylcobalamin-dependent ribonucleoside-diphosphate reductase [Bacteroidales bacterium]HOH22434.1 adenosylcobalamin-dependent ribonucleoside-diphosphate reductase [Bacteroidales bacterium]HPB56921.1 adenosylcobalamin-dependent ribonucleoside-diphosphate reductase [Bacteroidales bacterium]HPZ03575.1 adenosylcobalamin-dependent ribonucleoside-diphosphate reductase [Bacteroidales bacterium]HQB74967.1 adenosylcobalamin-dependent ribonucleoside-diphosphate reductase [Bacteroidales bacterium]
MNESQSFKPQNLGLFLEEEELILRKKNDEIVIKREQELERLTSSQTLFEGLEMESSTDINMVKEEVEEEPLSPPTYTKSEIFSEVVAYFNGDELAAGVWIDKYALKNDEGALLERTPDEMHRRLAKEFARIEKKYVNPMDEELIYSLFKNFAYIVPQGSPMAGIGNNYQIASLSNCFVIGNDSRSDSYGGIMKMDEEQVQLMKRRGGVGHDLSHIRPSGSQVKNCAITSTGVVPFMERYSNSTREVAQDGRRGALMLSISIKHPDAEHFIDAKMIPGKITGANVSVRIDNKFMEAVKNGTSYTQQYPIHSETPTYTQEIDARKLWNKIIHNAWKSAEPGVLFWDTIAKEAIPDCYEDEGFKTVSTNPCGEIPLCPYDSCRLIALNMYSYVKNPFTEEAFFDMTLFKQHVQYAQRLMDDIIDLEIEKIDQILAKVASDPETDDIKRVEMELWNKIKKQTLKGRRTGLGITAEGDMLAALNIRYGSDRGNAFSEEVHKQLALSAYRSSVTMAKERGAFPVYSCIKEVQNPFVLRLKKADEKLYEDMVRYGRRNIALLTIAPTGSVSICTQTTSGIEPAFNVYYKRRRKVNPNDLNNRKAVRDMNGDLFEEYHVFHPKFVTWAEIQGIDRNLLENMEESEIRTLVEKSPYYKSTAADTDYLKKVELQGMVQKWVDHSISVTINVPEKTTEETVGAVYVKAWESGCKGMTVYREGSREGIFISTDAKPKRTEEETKKLRRPKELAAKIVRFKNNNEDWMAFIGTRDGRPYEIFTGKSEGERFPVPGWVESGFIVKNRLPEGVKQYDFKYYDKDGYEVTMGGLSRTFNPEFWNYAKMISALLRHEIPIENVVNIIGGLNFREETINSWRRGVVRALQSFIADGTKQKGKTCPSCGMESIYFQEGCLTCSSCGYSKCG